MFEYEEYFPTKKRQFLFSVYTSFISELQNRVLTPEFCNEHYFEEHHIVCECYLPSDWSNEKKRFNNIVVVTGAEHFILHFILYLIFDDYNMTCAIHLMTNSKQNGSIDLIPHVYEQLRKDWARKHGVEMKGRIQVYSPEESDRLCRKIRPEELPRYLDRGYCLGTNPNYVFPEFSTERKARLSEANKEWYAEYYRTHESPHKGHRHSEESKALMRERAKGRKCPNKGKIWCHRYIDGVLERLPVTSENEIPEGWIKGFGPKGKYKGLSEETRKKQSEARRNNIWVHKGNERHFVMPDKVQEWLDKGFYLGSGIDPYSNKRNKEYNNKYEDSKDKEYKAKTLF